MISPVASYSSPAKRRRITDTLEQGSFDDVRVQKSPRRGESRRDRHGAKDSQQIEQSWSTKDYEAAYEAMS